MTEQLDTDNEKPPTVSLRKATEEDLLFLFKVSTEAMRPVVDELEPDKEFDEEVELAKYKEAFEPEKIDVIQYEDVDVGRLRVVRSPESIYVGGIQILPEFQGKGIGTALFNELIKESHSTNIPITLEVHEVNSVAISFYTKLGFVQGEKVGNQIILKYEPSL